MNQEKNTCENPSCNHTFEKSKLFQYYVCPFCSTKVEPEKSEQGCLHYFGYLRERESSEDISSECISFRMSVECMLTNQTSNDALKEIMILYK